MLPAVEADKDQLGTNRQSSCVCGIEQLRLEGRLCQLLHFPLYLTQNIIGLHIQNSYA